jgi:glutathione reductase (NADPH)
MSQYDFDLFVIGGGSGGVRAARIAGGHGASVAIAEEYRFGGTCVIRGCVPKKLMVYASRFRDDFEDSAGFGWTVEGARFDWPTLIANKDREIARLEAAYRRTVGNARATVFDTRATVADPHTVVLAGDGRRVRARTILVATGGHPVKPDIPGVEHAITSNEAFHLKELPASVLIVGGGYIAVEFAGIFNGLGSRTTLVYRGGKVLRGFDDDLRAALALEMRRQGVDLRFDRNVSRLDRGPAGLRATLTDGKVLDVDQVLFATGRCPLTQDLGLEAAGVELAPGGAVIVDEYSRSSVPSIWAVGDATDRINLTPVALHEAMCFVRTAFGDAPTRPDHRDVPSCVFSTPPLGSVGLTEAEAREHCGAVDVYKASFRPLALALGTREERTLVKLVVDPRDDRVLGVHMLGRDAGEIVQGFALALKCGATKAQFDATLGIHPTSAEELVTLREKWTG